MKRTVANLTDHERGELRRLVAAAMAEVMRDCDNFDVRSDAYKVLIEMKVIRP